MAQPNPNTNNSASANDQIQLFTQLLNTSLGNTTVNDITPPDSPHPADDSDMAASGPQTLSQTTYTPTASGGLTPAAFLGSEALQNWHQMNGPGAHLPAPIDTSAGFTPQNQPTVFSQDALNNPPMTAQANRRDLLAHNLGQFGEQIVTVIKNAAERHIADASSPLRVNLKKMEELSTEISNTNQRLCNTNQRLSRETTDLVDQNDTMSRQIDLHYRNFEQYSEHFNSQIGTLNRLMDHQAQNMAIVPTIIQGISQLSTTIPQLISSAVHTTIESQVNQALERVTEAQMQTMVPHQSSNIPAHLPSIPQVQPPSYAASNPIDPNIIAAILIQHYRAEQASRTTGPQVSSSQDSSSRLRRAFRRTFGRN